ncbi:hypothetical protein O6H91_15G057400 [Diphasiastrum complanatum]|uniref:Uncharacterized protein n=1 Tax=Diphasiastrum complanatum TaxID=34168 RepID=A0ACC2BIF0_DIPCM|nr:hypothetical protein O6H91_15G057400 [Diphasiastrum complanatum]
MTGEPEDEKHLNQENNHGENHEDWKDIVRRGGSLKEVDLDQGVNGWASPPGSVFMVRGRNYFVKKLKSPSADWILKPLGVDWLKSNAKLDHVLARSDNRVMRALETAQVTEGKGLKDFVVAVNLQVPGKEHYSAVFYFVTEDPILPGTLLYRFIHEDDAFRNSRFKLINRIVRGPWIVKATVGNHAACLLGKALTCHYIRGPNYFEIDVDIGSSTVATYILHLALGYVTSVSVDMAFLIESQADDELPERILGAVRIAQIEMESAAYVESQTTQDKGTAACQGSNPQSNLSWRSRLGRGFSLLGNSGKISKTEDKGADK